MGRMGQKKRKLWVTLYKVDGIKASPFFSKPDAFLKVGTRVEALGKIYDTPNPRTSRWGRLHASTGERGTVIEVLEGCWPIVRFDRTGTTSNVTDLEVRAIA
jgi:hypothetical protein